MTSLFVVVRLVWFLQTFVPEGAGDTRVVVAVVVLVVVAVTVALVKSFNRTKTVIHAHAHAHTCTYTQTHLQTKLYPSVSTHTEHSTQSTRHKTNRTHGNGSFFCAPVVGDPPVSSSW